MKFKKSMFSLAAVIAFALASPYAFATPGNSGGGNGGCGVGQTTNGCGSDVGNPSSNTSSGIGVGIGVGVGMGGNGGAGGNAIANGGSANSNNTNLNGNNNTNRNDNANSNVNNNRNSNRNANTNKNNNNLANSQGQGQGQIQGQMQGQVANGGRAISGGNTLQGTQANGQSVSVTGDTVTYEAQSRNPVNTAYAPNIAPTATCMGSTSAGAQGIGFGISIGSTWTAEECQVLEQGRFAAQVLGQTEVASEIACSLDKYREARKRVGKPCAQDVEKSKATASVEVPPVASANSEQPQQVRKVAASTRNPIVKVPNNIYIN